MAYYRYTRLQQYIGGQPTDVYTKGQRADSTEYTTYEDCMAGSDVTRWVAIPQTTCVDGDLWSMEKEQATFDGGETWADTGNTRPVAVIEPDSDRCTGADSDWRIVTGEYICNGTSKCVKEVEYVNVEGSWVPSGRTRAGSIIEILSADCGVMYQWVNVPGEYICVFKCGRGDKYTKQKQQYSLDGGTSWSDTGETREGDFVEKNSAYCGCDTSVTRWITVEGEYVCVGTSKYTKEKEQTSADGTVWTDTGNTRAGSLIETSSSSCQNVQTRWVTASGQYSCVGYDKYSMDKEQQSTDGGTTWTDTGNTRAGSTLIEANSSDCGYHPQSITRWITVSGDYTCQGTDKYNKEKEQISYDSGSTWTDTGNTRAGSIIEADSEDCGYLPPEGMMAKSTYTDGHVEYTPFYCSTKYYGNKGGNDPGVVSLVLYDVVRYVDNYACSGWSSLKSVTIPEGVRILEAACFAYTGLTEVTVPASVTSIGCIANGGVFIGCTSLETATILSTAIERTTMVGTGTATIYSGVYMFGGCIRLKNVTLASGTPAIASCMFSGCSSLKSLTIPSSVTHIGGSAFAESGLTSLTLPESLQEIDGSAFYKCNGLDGYDLTLPRNLKTLAGSAFSSVMLASITLLSETPPTLIGSSFDYNYPIYVPAQSVDLYKASSGWKNMSTRIFPIQ